MTYGSLFSGIGGMDLGLDRAGWECAFQVEIDDYCRRVLAKHWPHVPKYADIREVTGEQLGRCDLLAGGFPCQDVSDAGRRVGIDGARSGLWSEFARLVGELRPRFVLVENTPGLLRRGMGRVLGDLAALGYDAEWQSIPAASVGAPHLRDRLFVISYPAGTRLQGDVTAGEVWGRGLPAKCDWWRAEPKLVRVAARVPGRVDMRIRRTAALGNAVVPQVAEWIGRRILEAAQ